MNKNINYFNNSLLPKGIEMVKINNIYGIKTIKRTMMGGIGGPGKWGQKLFRFPKTTINKTIERNSPGNYKVVKYTKKTIKEDSSPLDEHEEKHYNVFDVETGEVIAILTSCKKDGLKLEAIKMDGTFTKFKDNDGNIIPHPEKGGQYFRLLETIRVVDKNTMKEYPPGTVYLKKHTKAIDIYAKEKNVENLPRARRITKEEYQEKQKFNKNTNDE